MLIKNLEQIPEYECLSHKICWYMIEQKELTESNKNSFIRNEAPFVPGEGFFIDVIYERR